MPLTSPSPRKSLHDREISCTGFHRSDGLWDIEGRLTDKKIILLKMRIGDR